MATFLYPPNIPIAVNNKSVEYINLPCAFDIETTSFYEGPKKDGKRRAIMYAWVIGYNHQYKIGRTWEDALKVFDELIHVHNCNDKRRLVVYVHNLDFEFQFIRKRFTWTSVFALDDRKVVKALTATGIEFRCSYQLSGMRLELVGESLGDDKAKKDVGKLDYSLLRHAETPLTDEELGYIRDDALVVMDYIEKEINRNRGLITNIPITKTGYVRRDIRNYCLFSGKHHQRRGEQGQYGKIVQSQTLEVEEYQQLKRCFQGGFTHANCRKSGKKWDNVKSYDFTSSYPSVMVSCYFPMSKGERIAHKLTLSEYRRLIDKYCVMIDVKFYNLQSISSADNIISASKCWYKLDVVEDNGRVWGAECIGTTITELDFLSISKFYKWDKIEFGHGYFYKRHRLPRLFIQKVLQYYKDKTMLKGVIGFEEAYALAKELINSCYGMCVTDIVRDEITYTDNWHKEAPDINKAITKYNNDKNRFLVYGWGVYITAWARYFLFTALLELGNDYIYADTDSVKFLHHEKHEEYFEKYNERLRYRMEKASRELNIDFDYFEPTTKDGKKKLIGAWDYDGDYDSFKTLGAKRYIYTQNGELHTTIAGVGKKKGAYYLLKLAKKEHKDVFDLFEDGLFFPPEGTGKLIHTYLDEMQEGYLTDYLGNTLYYNELSSIHLEGCDYTLGLSQQYKEFLEGITYPKGYKEN